MKENPAGEVSRRSVPWCLDIPYEYKHFNSRSLAEAGQLFLENSIDYQEYLAWMPKPCLHFYIHAYIIYLFSDASCGDSDGASCFLSLVELRTENIKSGGKGLVHTFEPC